MRNTNKLTHCAQCGHQIVSDDDDAGVCIECGGMNRRILNHAQFLSFDGKAIAIIVVVVITVSIIGSL